MEVSKDGNFCIFHSDLDGLGRFIFNLDGSKNLNRPRKTSNTLKLSIFFEFRTVGRSVFNNWGGRGHFNLLLFKVV